MLKKVLLAGGVVVVALVALVGVAWAVDRSRGVELGGRKVEGDPAAEIARLAEGFGETPIVVHTPDGDLRSTATELGVTIDEAATRQAVEDAESGGPGDWLSGLRTRRTAPLIVRAEADGMRSVVRVKDPTERVEPVEPAIEGTADGISISKGKPGRGLDPDDVADAIREAARAGGDRIEAEVEPVDLAPRYRLAQAEALADRARALTEEPLDVRVGEASAEIGPKTLRSWVRSTDLLELALDTDEVVDELDDELEVAETEPVDATISIQGGVPVITPGRNGTKCCGDEAADRILQALLERPDDAVALPVTTVEPRRTSEDIRELGIVEQIGSFTTRHPAGQPRVTNIHRIADLIDGTLIGPGGRFSVNDKVGERTTEKGFVVDHSIQDGKFVDTVGGGISQFATTLFNAAFFGGLDIPEYQAHSIYISRYPYGREATLSFPKPDLVISNTTPYGVLIDASYTSTSLTVTLWSTKFAHGEQTAQSEAPAGDGPCKRVKTERTRTYVDGRAPKVDNVFAVYRPEEGVKC